MSVADRVESPAEVAKPPRRRRTRVLLGLGVAVAVSIAAVSVVLSRPGPEAAAPKPSSRSTAQVALGDLVEQTLVQGSLNFTGEQKLSGPAGILTAHADAGSVVTAGQSLFAVDNLPVVLMTGPIPQWREFSLGMTPGPDVQQLEATLAELGYFWGGADEVFDANTREGIRIWQQNTGRPVTGTIGLGEVLFAPGPLRVASSDLALGAPTGPGTAILTVTTQLKSVRVDLKLAQQRLAVLQARVEVELPGGKRTPGTVTEVDPPRQPEQKDQGGGESASVVPVTVTLDTPEDALAFDKAGVRVFFTSETSPDALQVPVGALIALPGGVTGVEVVHKDGTTKRVPVETGLFAGGIVAITGDGIAEGTTVVVPDA